MKSATIEVLEEGEVVLGSPVIGRYQVREYVDNEEVGGQFFKTMQEANDHVSQYIKEDDDA